MTAAAERGADDWDVGSLVEWVETSLLPVYVRPVDRTALHWCPTWWRHMEAWARFEACHRAWQALLTDPGTGFSVWHRDHLDPMLRELLSDTGPFAHCSPGEGHENAQHRPAGDYAAEPVEFQPPLHLVTDTEPDPDPGGPDA